MNEYSPERDAEGREVVQDESGERFPVTSGPSDAAPRFTPEQMRKVAGVYSMIAQALPVEGRDYSVSFSFREPNGNPSVSLSARTEIGKAFIRHLYTVLGKRA